MTTHRWRVPALAFAIIVLTACTPTTSGPITIDIEELPDGQLARRVMYLEQGWRWDHAERLGSPDQDATELQVVGTDEHYGDDSSFIDWDVSPQVGFGLSDDGGATWRPFRDVPTDVPWEMSRSACPTKTLCVRIQSGARIEESDDGGDSWTTVWDLDTRDGWLNASQSEVNLVVEAYDIEVLSDGSVVVAMGELDPVVRSRTAEWTPTVAELRTIPKAEVTRVLIALLAMLWLIASWCAARSPDSRFLKRFVAGLGLTFFTLVVFVVDILESRGDFFEPVYILAWLSLAIGGLCTLSLIFALVSEPGEAESTKRNLLTHAGGRIRRLAVVLAVSAIVFTVACAGVNALWSHDRLSWGAAGLSIVGSFIVLASTAGRLLTVPAPAPAASHNPYRNVH